MAKALQCRFRTTETALQRFILLMRHLIQMFVAFDFFLSNRLAIDGTPCVHNVSQHKRNKHRHVSHGLQGKQAGTAVG